MIQWKGDRRNYFMINPHESMGPGQDRTRDPWICSQIRICSQTRYRLRYAARFGMLGMSLFYNAVLSVLNSFAVISLMKTWADQEGGRRFAGETMMAR